MRRSLCLALVVAAAACGGGSGYPTTGTTNPPAAPPPAPPPPPPPGGATKVAIADFSFSPSTITVSVGTTVSWTNGGGTTHTVTSNTGVFDSGMLAPPNAQTGTPGATFSYTFSSAGTFAYHCSIHPQMTGTVTVTP